MQDRDGAPTRIGCPGCAGVLSVEGEWDVVRYVCTVGHAFSVTALLQAKEEQFEHGMWAVISILAHIDMAYQAWLEQSRSDPSSLPREPFEARIQQVRAHAHTLRTLLEHDRPPALEMADGELGAT